MVQMQIGCPQKKRKCQGVMAGLAAAVGLERLDSLKSLNLVYVYRINEFKNTFIIK